MQTYFLLSSYFSGGRIFLGPPTPLEGFFYFFEVVFEAILLLSVKAVFGALTELKDEGTGVVGGGD